MSPILFRAAKSRQGIAIQLATATGVVFACTAQAAALRTSDGTIDITSRGESYLSVSAALLTIHTAEGETTFQIETGIASLKAGRLSVIAEAISKIE
jgi:F0F1-type ATP synthase epsilon subunit